MCQKQDLYKFKKSDSFKISLLLERPNSCFTREHISSVLWSHEVNKSRCIDAHISRLRKKLVDTEVYIEAVYGGGYVLR